MEVLLAENKVSERRKGRGEQNGFTLVEMMVTVAIGAILLAFAFGAYNELRERTRVDSAKEHIVSILQQARMRALTSGENQVVAFDWAADTITYSGETSTFDVVDLKGFRTAGSKTNDTNTDNTFTFTSRGRVLYGGSPVIGGGSEPEELQISSANSPSVFLIQFNSVTGRIAAVGG